MAQWCAERTNEEALRELADVGLPAGPVLTPQECLDHPQVAAMNLLRMVDYPGLDKPAPVPDLPVHLSESHSGIHSPPPRTGEHTEEILTSLGYTAEQIGELRTNGVV